MFTGVYYFKIDTKGRISVPAQFRANAEGKFYVTYSPDKSLVVYDDKGFAEFEDRLKKLNDFDPQVRDLKRIFYGGVAPQDCDSHGRIKLPPSIIDFAGIEKDVVVNGMSNHFEIWDKARFEQKHQQAIANYFQNSSAMTGKLD